MCILKIKVLADLKITGELQTLHCFKNHILSNSAGGIPIKLESGLKRLSTQSVKNDDRK